MTASEAMRDQIARVLHRQDTDDGEVHVLWGGADEQEDEVAEWLPFADALLAAFPWLADEPRCCKHEKCPGGSLCCCQGLSEQEVEAFVEGAKWARRRR